MLNTGRARTDLPTIAVRSGLGRLGGLAVGTFLGCVALTAMVISHVATDGVTLAAAVSLLFTGGAGVRCVMVVRRIGRAGLRRRLAVSADGLEFRPVDSAALVVAWDLIDEVGFSYEDVGGFPLWHVWTVRRRTGEVDVVRYPAGLRARPSQVRAAIRCAAPMVQVTGSWRDPAWPPNVHGVMEGAGRAPEPPSHPTVVRGRYGLALLVAAAAALFFVLLAAVCLVLSIAPPDDDPALWPGVVVLSVTASLLCAALPLRIIRSGRRIHLWASLDEIGFRTADFERPGRAAWGRVVAVEYAKEDARGIVYTHIWTIRFDDRPPVTVRYPAGASVRPRYFRHLVRRLAPHVQVSGGWW